MGAWEVLVAGDVLDRIVVAAVDFPHDVLDALLRFHDTPGAPTEEERPLLAGDARLRLEWINGIRLVSKSFKRAFDNAMNGSTPRASGPAGHAFFL
jgi:hypothetical protein